MCCGPCSSPGYLKSPRFPVRASGVAVLGRIGGRPWWPAWPSLWVTFWPGPSLPKTQLILAINWKGVYFLDQKERTLLELSFAEVMGLVANR